MLLCRYFLSSAALFQLISRLFIKAIDLLNIQNIENIALKHTYKKSKKAFVAFFYTIFRSLCLL